MSTTAEIPTPVVGAPNYATIKIIGSGQFGDVFKAIKKQTGLTVFYSNALLIDKPKVNVSFRNATVSDVIEYL